VKLSRDDRRAIINEMVLSELFSEKAWSRRYGISVRTVKRLRAQARELIAINAPRTIQVFLLDGVRDRKRA
jgi:hypothetical protein